MYANDQNVENPDSLIAMEDEIEEVILLLFYFILI